MRTIQTYTVVTCLLIASSVRAQGPNSAIAPDFVLTDIDGVERELYSYLDQGKTVVLDMFATWCGPCANSQAGLQVLWNAHGTPGDNTVMIIGCELDGSTFDEPDFRDFFNIQYPMIRAESLWLVWHTIVYPTIAVICPDRSWHLVQQDIGNNPGPLLAYVNQCPHPTLARDARAVDYRGPLAVCGQSSFTPAIRMQNLGVEPMTSCSIETWADGVLQNTYAWSGTLTQYQIKDSVELPPLSGLGNTVDLSFRITDVNGAPDNNMANNQVDKTIGMVVQGNAITLRIQFDDAPYEISWKLFDASGNVVHEHDPYDAAVNGPGSVYTETWQLMDQQCYRFEIDDYFGDGLCCYMGNGNYQLRDANNAVFHQGGHFDLTDSFSFVPDATAGTQDRDPAAPLNVYPDPSTGVVNFGPLPVNGDAWHMEVFNALGMRIPDPSVVDGPSSEWRSIDMGAFGEGIYFLHVFTHGRETVRRVMVIR